MGNEYVEGKDKNQILSELVGTAQPGSRVHEQQKMAIIVRCTEDVEAAMTGLRQSIGNLESSIDRNAKSSDNLARKVFWLKVVIMAATVIGVAIAAYSTF